MAVNDPEGVLDRDLTNYDTAYRTFVTDQAATKQVIIDWHQAAFGTEPAPEWIEHNRWRASVERLWWKTLRAALQDAAPLPFEPVPPGKIEQLRAQRHYLIGVSGTRFTARCASDFRLFKNWLDGIDIAPVVDQRVACGYNMVRVLGTCDFMFHLYPQEYPQYFEQLPIFRQFLEGHGLYLQFTAFADATKVMPALADQQTFWNKVVAALQGTALLELVNENDQTINHLDAAQFSRPTGVLTSHGSNGSQAWPVEPHWDWVAFHTNGAPEEQRKIGHNAWEIWAGPTITNETSRYPEVGMWAGQPLERQKMLAYDSGAGAALLCAGYCFHSVNGKQSVLWDGNEQEIAREMARGALSVPLQYQDGDYTASHLEGIPLNPDELRRYARKFGSDMHWVSIHA